MKGFLLLAVIASSIYVNSALINKNFESKIKEVGEKCRKEFKVEDDEYMELMENEKIPESEAGYCLITCFMKELGLFHDGKLDVEAMKASVKNKYSDEESIKKGEEIVVKCMEKVDTNDSECNLNTKYVKCYVEMAKKEGLEAKSSA